MKLYTAQLNKYSGEDLVDITIKSGNKSFSPTWDMVKRFKSGELNEEDFTSLYKKLMEESIHNNHMDWLGLIQKQEATIACYCREEWFCHRYLLAEIIKEFAEKQGINVVYDGEREELSSEQKIAQYLERKRGGDKI